MQNVGRLAGRTIFITGASRGIGKDIAVKCAKDGANIVIAAKTAQAHPKLPGTIYTAAKEIEDAGGKCLPCIVDIRSEEQVEKAVQDAVDKFGGIDILVNNASAIHLTGTVETPMKKYDLMHQVNIRGTYLCGKYCAPHLKKGTNPHILNISPPLNMNPRWFKDHVAYTMAKYGMSMCVKAWAEEFKCDGIAANALWPQTGIYTAAMEMLGGGDQIKTQCRKPEIMSDAAYAMLVRDSRSYTGNFAIDEDVLREEGVKDFSQYNYVENPTLLPDFFLDEASPEQISQQMKEQGANLKFDIKSDSGPKTESATPGSPALDGTFASLKSMVNEDFVKSIGASYNFDLKESGKWHLDLKNGSGSAGAGEIPGGSDVTFIMSEQVFTNMFNGNISATSAFMTGKMKIKGDLGKAMKLEKLMKAMVQKKSML